MLEGQELVGKIGDVGEYIVDVDAEGKVKISAVVAKDMGHTKVANTLSVETDIFALAEAIAKKTETTLDDKAIAGIKAILGIGKVVEPAV